MSRERVLLLGGAWGAGLFVAVFLANDAVKPGYEPARDLVSEAAIGAGGWVQVVNFVVAGGLLAGSSFALSRVVGRWTGILVRVVGAGLVAAGVFVSDPVPQERVSWHGVIHNVVSVAVFSALSAACFTAACWRATTAWRWYCRVVGVAVPVLFVTTGAVTNSGGVWQRLTIVAGWSWLVVLNLRAAR
ncbi:DUF998 domain-containing protein [Actinoplanes sp. NPDC048988]|uniref:DUF998 domain-containing protein n=1 Tax=Actinoplanes sp. NPDC048988 TaxID=3363901 RepID=UPI0037210EF4